MRDLRKELESAVPTSEHRPNASDDGDEDEQHADNVEVGRTERLSALGSRQLFRLRLFEQIQLAQRFAHARF